MTYNVFSGTLNLTQSVTHEDATGSFYVKLLTNRQTDRQTERQMSGWQGKERDSGDMSLSSPAHSPASRPTTPLIVCNSC